MPAARVEDSVDAALTLDCATNHTSAFSLPNPLPIEYANFHSSTDIPAVDSDILFVRQELHTALQAPILVRGGVSVAV